jgi:hypothetical protein
MRDVFKAYGLPSDEEYERQGRETDDFISRCADRARDHSGSGSSSVPHVIYKTYETPPPRQQQINDLDPAVQARWDAWFDARFKQCLFDQFEEDAFLDQIFAEAASITREQVREKNRRAA